MDASHHLRRRRVPQPCRSFSGKSCLRSTASSQQTSLLHSRKQASSPCPSPRWIPVRSGETQNPPWLSLSPIPTPVSASGLHAGSRPACRPARGEGGPQPHQRPAGPHGRSGASAQARAPSAALSFSPPLGLGSLDFPQLWYRLSRDNNPTAFIVPKLRSLGAEMPTIAWSKIYELLAHHRLLEGLNGPIRTVHVCEAVRRLHHPCPPLPALWRGRKPDISPPGFTALSFEPSGGGATVAAWRVCSGHQPLPAFPLWPSAAMGLDRPHAQPVLRGQQPC